MDPSLIEKNHYHNITGMHYNDSMKTDNTPRKKKKFDGLLVLAILLFVAGVALLLVDPIRAYKRAKKAEEGLGVVEAQIAQIQEAGSDSEEEPVVTFVVPKDANAIDGEEYDYFTDNEEDQAAMSSMLEEEMNNMPDYVTLTAIGVLNIDSVGINIAVWDEATVVSLRYGGGHYVDSVLPGEKGNCTILAHHMRRSDTMFHKLDQVQLDDEIKFTDVKGHTYTYVVDEIKIIHGYELEDNIIGDITDTRQITLVTCSYTSTEKMRLLVIGHIK